MLDPVGNAFTTANAVTFVSQVADRVLHREW
jgi:hypothetical protein